MKHLIMVLNLSFVVLFNACNGETQSADNSTVTDENAPKPPVGQTTDYFAYVLNSQSNTISAYKIEDNGTLTHIGTDRSTEIIPMEITVSVDKKTIYVVNYASNSISAYQIANDGTLGTPTTISTQLTPMSLTFDLTGTYAYVASLNTGGNLIHPEGSLFYMNIKSGPFNFVDTAINTGPDPITAKIDPLGKFLFVLSDDRSIAEMNWLYSYPIASDGTISSRKGVFLGDLPKSFAVNPSGNNLYISISGYVDNDPLTEDVGYTHSYTINRTDGTVTYMAGEDYAEPISSSNFMYASPNGKFVYNAIYNTDEVIAYSVKANGGLLRVGTNVTGDQPTSINVEPRSKFAYVTNKANHSIFSYTINSDGSLSKIGEIISGGTGPNYIVTVGVAKN